MKSEVVNTIVNCKLIAILRNIPKDKFLSLSRALYDGGIRLLEVTFDASGAVSDDQTAESIKILADEFYGKMFIGAGTVLTKKQVALTKKAGGSFIISPNTDKSVIRKSCKLGMVSIPGALTPSEIVSALNYGADFVKLFPTANLGADYVRAVSASLSNARFLAVGGINADNIHNYLKCGVCGFALGSNITDKKMIEENDWAGITRLVKKYVTVTENA